MAYQISGRVIKGDGYGKNLGFPTANLERRQWARLKRKPKLGVWAGIAEIVSTSPAPRMHSGHPPQGIPQISQREIRGTPAHRLGRGNRKFYAGIVIGPYDKYHLPKIEAHLLSFKGNLYGKYLNIYLNKYLRPFKKYQRLEDLKRQIRKDINFIKKLKI
jgi:riboflavin kinase/FMN adenylyltransferase